MKNIFTLAFMLLSVDPSTAEVKLLHPPAAAPQLQKPGPAPSEPEPSATKVKTMTTDGLACKSRADADALLRILISKDDHAFQKFQTMHVGDCRVFRKGERLLVEERAFSDSICVRARGDRDCYWVNSAWVTP
jgi:hypothetical protein